MKDDLEQFVEYVTPLGKDYKEFLLYAMRSHTDRPFRPPDLSVWPEGTQAVSFILEDYSPPVIVELFEIRSPTFPVHYGLVLSSGLSDLTHQGATLCWYMFDGVFIGRFPMLTQWEIENTYGVSIPGQEPRLAITKAERRSKSWADLLAKASEHVYRQHPELKSL